MPQMGRIWVVVAPLVNTIVYVDVRARSKVILLDEKIFLQVYRHSILKRGLFFTGFQKSINRAFLPISAH